MRPSKILCSLLFGISFIWIFHCQLSTVMLPLRPQADTVPGGTWVFTYGLTHQSTSESLTSSSYPHRRLEVISSITHMFIAAAINWEYLSTRIIN